MEETVISLRGVEKTYAIYETNKEKYLDFFLPRTYGKHFYALRDIHLEIKRGESWGLIGLNGSGKSTLANVIAGACAPTAGEIDIKGSVSMMAISAGVSPMLTGLENITQKCLLLGLSHQKIKEITPQIVEFADLGAFMHQQVKTYSSGMRAKLAFAISVNIDPDILILDEALSVGDPTFTEKCLVKMKQFRERGKTIIFVSHSIIQIREFCNHSVWLEGGKIRQMGECHKVTVDYVRFIREFNGMQPGEKEKYLKELRQKQFGVKT